jgi:hypothetical protein
VNVVLAVADGDPADGLIFLPVRRQPGAVHHVMRDGGPFVVGQQPVFRRGPQRAVPHRPRVGPLAERGLRLQEQAGQFGEVPRAIGPQRGFQVSRVTPPGDDVGISMFFPAAWTKEVVEQRLDVFPARGADLPDHRSS